MQNLFSQDMVLAICKANQRENIGILSVVVNADFRIYTISASFQDSHAYRLSKSFPEVNARISSFKTKSRWGEYPKLLHESQYIRICGYYQVQIIFTHETFFLSF